MKLSSIFFVLFLPVIAFASLDEYYIQKFAENFKERKFSESLQILENWERELNKRQGINPDIQNNSFFKYLPDDVSDLQVI